MQERVLPGPRVEALHNNIPWDYIGVERKALGCANEGKPTVEG